MIPAVLRKWTAYGSGLGFAITGPRGAETLEAAAVRVRPGGAVVLATARIEDFPHRPAAEWGNEIQIFARQHGVGHVVAAVMLARQDVIVRSIALPGVSDKDLDAAVRFQLDGLHPYAEDEVIASWSRLPETPTVLVAIARREGIDRYSTLFAEAGIKIGQFMCSAPALYSVARLFGEAPALPLLAIQETEAGAEVYGESAAKAVYSSAPARIPLERAVAIATAELRLEEAKEPFTFSQLVGSEPALAVAAGIHSALPRHVLGTNLLPEGQRQASSPLKWVPSAALGLAAIVLGGALYGLPGYEEKRFTRTLNQEISRVEPQVNRAGALEKQIQTARQRTELLDELRRRPKADMDTLLEMTRILPPPTWLNLFELSAKQVTVGGETDQAAPLLKTIDSSPYFEGSEFTASPVRMQAVEMFRVRTNRKARAAGTPPAQAQAQAPQAPAAPGPVFPAKQAGAKQ